MIIKLTFYILFLLFANNYLMADEVCKKWFNAAKLKLGTEDCLLKCTTLITDFGTFNCHTLCPELCGLNVKEKYAFKLSKLYPGLTAEERALCGKYPDKMLKAYDLARKSESLCEEEYKTLETNDESDACRHFMWASYLTKEFGREFAEEILNAHEKESHQSEEERAMDLANNRITISVAEKLIKKGELNEVKLKEELRTQLRDKNLVVLKPRAKQKGK